MKSFKLFSILGVIFLVMTTLSQPVLAQEYTVNYASDATSVTAIPAMPTGYWVNGTNPLPKLTDGLTTTGLNWNLACGWTNALTTDSLIIIDLGTIRNEIGAVRLDFARYSVYSILNSVEVSGSLDGVTYYPWGVLTDTLPEEGAVMHPWVWQLEGTDYVNARYVMLKMNWAYNSYSKLLYEIFVYKNPLVPVELSSLNVE